MAARILIVDDHAAVRKGLIRLFAGSRDTISLDEAGDGEEALAKVHAGDYDLVLLDISMPGRNGLDVLVEIKRRKPGLPVLMLSIHPEEQYAVQALRAGASGYLTKKRAPYELVNAVQRILQGGDRYFD